MFKKITGLLSVLAIYGFMSVSAHAATVSIVAPDLVAVGDTFDIEFWGDFEDGLTAGGIQMSYDSSLLDLGPVVFNNAAFNPPGIDQGFSCPGAGGCPPIVPGTATIIWGSFNTLLNPGSGPTLMATINATALAPSAAALLTLSDFSQFTGGWFGANFVSIPVPELLGASVEISQVPLPAAAWLFGSGLLGLVGIARRKKTA